MNDTPPDSPQIPGENPEEIIAPRENSEPPKKRRGRPPKNPNLQAEKVDSSSAPKTRKVKTSYDEGLLTQQVVGIHMMAAQFSGIPEVVITPDEGKALAKSIILVADQYELSIDGKTGAFIQLLATAAMIYAPRFMMVKHRMSQTVEAETRVVPSEN